MKRASPVTMCFGNVFLLVLSCLIVLCAAVGCNSVDGGTTRVIGPVTYDRAFGTSQEVMRQYFRLDGGDHPEGVIKSRPQSVRAKSGWRSDNSTLNREVTLHLRDSGEYVSVTLAVSLSRRSSHMRMMTSHRGDFSQMGRHTPAMDEAATTLSQNESWEFVRYDHALERKILDQIQRTLIPTGKATAINAPQQESDGAE